MDFVEDFYLVLPSNSSMGFYPENTTTCFTTQLFREMRLTGDWSVGLAEIHVPCTIMHIQDGESVLTFNVGAADKSPIDNKNCHIPHGIYENVEKLADEINRIPIVREHQILSTTSHRKGYYELRRTCACDQPHYTTLSEKMRRIFGFEAPVHRLTGTFATSKNGTTSNVGTRPTCLTRAIPDQLYVYTDICEPYMVGDTQVALLRIVPLDSSRYKFGSNVVKYFAPIHYVPLLQHTFRNIIIDIRDEYGRKIPFEYGTLTVSLHFV